MMGFSRYPAMGRLLVVTCLCACFAHAEQDSCSLSGIVRTPQKKALAGADIRIASRVVKTDAKGHFCFPNLGPGGYTVTITAAGFKPYSLKRHGAQRVLRPISMKSSAAGGVGVGASPYLAENGRNNGAVISLLTPSGEKLFHGSLGLDYRHESFAANDFFNNRNGIARPRSRGESAGYNLGGPVYFPGFNHERTKLFFFFSQDFQRQPINYGTRTVRVPTERERLGDFSQSFDAGGQLILIHDPSAGQEVFPGNIIPATRFNSAGQNILKLFPLPNFTDPNPANRDQWNYISSASGAAPRRTNILRLDLSPSKNLQIHSRVSHTRDEQRSPFGLPIAGSMNFPLTSTVFQQPLDGATIHFISTISKTAVNSLMLGASRDQRRYFADTPARVSRTATGIDLPQWYPASNPQGLLPNMTFSDVPNFANPSLPNGLPYRSDNRMLSLSDNLSQTHGAHGYKFGVYIERSIRDESAQLISRGAFSFDRDRSNPFDANYGYANALLGAYQSYTEPAANPRGEFRFTNVELYAQDAWRARPNLSVDYGIRVHHDPPQYDRQNQLAAFVPALYSAATAPALLWPGLDTAGSRVALDPRNGGIYPQAMIGMLAPGSDPAAGLAIGGKGVLPPGLYSTPFLSFSPRLGVSWDPFRQGRTVVRAGGGAFFDRISPNQVMNALMNAPSVYTRSVYYGTVEQLTEAVDRRAISAPGSMTSLIGSTHMPSVYQFNLGVQQQVGQAMMIDLAYVGSLSRHVLWQRDINPVSAGATNLALHPEDRDPTIPSIPLPLNFLRPYPGYGSIYMAEFAGTANYNSLQLNANRRMAAGIQLYASYTMSKTLGSAPGEGAMVSPFFNPRERNYGPVPWDMTHVGSLRFTWTLPKPGKHLPWHFLGAITDGWELASMAQFTTGTPFLPSFSTVDGMDVAGTPSEAARVSVGDPSAAPELRFVRTPSGSFGNAGVGVLRGPGMSNWDLSTSRQVKFGKGWTLSIRADTFNTFNHTQFAVLSSNATFDLQGAQVDPMFLQPVGARSPRRMQFAMRLTR